jgi:hypothetical protein
MVTAKAVPSGALYIDLYAADGMVQHLRRNMVPNTGRTTDVPVTAMVSGPPGTRLLIAIAVSSPLNLALRPAQESAATYLPALQRELDRLAPDASPPRAEIAILAVTAPPPTLPPPTPLSSPPARESPPRPAQPRVAGRGGDSRCAAIIERVQLGEGLSSTDREILQTSCGR